jgi:hypothetical protein
MDRKAKLSRKNRKNRKNRKTRQNGGTCPCAGKMFGGTRRMHKKRGGKTRKMRH